MTAHGGSACDVGFLFAGFLRAAVAALQGSYGIGESCVLTDKHFVDHVRGNGRVAGGRGEPGGGEGTSSRSSTPGPRINR